MIYKDPQQLDSDLPAPLLTTLVEAVSPVSLSAERSARLHARLADRIHSESKVPSVASIADAFITLEGSASPGDGWVEMLPKAHAKLLFTDGQAESYMIRLEPGAWAPAHEHPADEECLVLEGSLWQGDVYLKAGDFHVARPGMKHGELRTDTGALVFIRYGRPLSEYLRM